MEDMGKREIVLVLSMLLLLISSSEGQVNQFDYFQLIIQWQPAACSSSTLPSPCVNPPQNRYSIHGVWPSLDSGASAQCSGTPPYDGRLLTKSIRDRLDRDWPSVVYGINPTLWSHEWTAHGTCSSSSMNQVEYFTFGLDEFANYDLRSMLAAYDINPDGKEYSRADVEAAIYCGTGGKWAALRCNRNKAGQKQLYEIALCFTKDNRELVDCPLNAVTCSSKFLWSSWSNRVEDKPAIASS